MGWIQKVAPNFSVTETAGLCLQFARRVFGAPKVEDTAWEAWTKAKYRHADHNFPAGMSVPIFFDWWGNILWTDGIYRYGQYGHAAVRRSDGRIYSSPGVGGPGQKIFNSIEELENYFGGGMKYVGWTEDISKVRVVAQESEVATVKTDINDARIFAHGIAGRNGFDGRPNALKGESDADLKQYHVGKDVRADAHAWYDSPEGKRYREVTLPQVYKERDTYKAQLAAANDQLKKVSEQSALATSLQRQVDDLTKKNDGLLAEQKADAKAGESFLRRVGQLLTKLLPK